MEAAESTLLDFVEKMRAWIPRRADPSNISRDFWMPDHSCRVCYECDSQFTLFNRRHHCRICGRVFCRKCTQNTIPVSGDGRKNGNGEDGERIKVCNFCFKLWKQEIASQCDGLQLPPTPPPQDICPSPSVISLDSNSSSTVYPTGPYQHISSNFAAKSPQANGFEPLPGRKQEDILHSERNNSAFSSVEGASSPSLLAYCVSRSDDEGDEYGKDVEDAQEGLSRHSQEYFGQHGSVDLHPGYILQNICANNSSSQNSMDQAIQLNGLSSIVNSTEDVLSKSPSCQNDILVERQMSGRSERSGEETEYMENFNDCNDDSVMFQSQNSELEQPFDFENNAAIWIPPAPEDVEDDIEASVIDDDDDDDEDGSWGLAHSSGSFSSIEFKSKERSSEDHREAMRTVLDGHFRALVAQLLKGADVSVGEENYNESWVEIVTSLSWQAATFVKPDTSKGGGMDPGGYVKVKCIASGHRSDSKVIKGIVCSKNVKHKRMTQRYKNPRMLLLGGALEYQRVSNQLSSLDTLLQQEMDHLKMTVARIEAHRPNVLLVEKTVSHHAQEYLLTKEISLVLNVKKKLLDRIARCTGAEIVPSLDNLAAPKVGHCELFHVERFLEEHGSAGQSGKKQAKTLMFFEGCPKRLGCTVLLMGASHDQLKKVKHVVQYAVFAAYHLALETCFLADEGATMPELPLKSPITVALPDKQLSLDRSISMIPSSSVPIPEQNQSGEIQNLKTLKSLPCVSALADDHLIDNNEGESKPLLISGGISPSMSHITCKSGPNGTSLVQTKFLFKTSSIVDTCAQVTGIEWDTYPSGQRPSLPPTSGGLSGLPASINAYSNEIVTPVGSGSYGAVTSYLELQDRESKDSDMANGFTVSVSSKINHNYQIATEELSRKVPWENQGMAEKEMKTKVFSDEQFLGDRNQEQIFSKEDFPPSPSDHQSILVLLSSRCVLKGTVCERSQLFRIKYYGSFDKPLGRYLRDDLFDQNSRCRFCNEPSEAHVLCYTHRQGSLTISVRQLPLLLTLPGEREGKIWMWHRCLKCARKDGVPEATRRVVMSDAAWGLSFGKFLELSFSNHAAASRVASCGHSLHRDCLRFYGFGSMIACFRYSSINVLSVHLPPSKLEFHDPHQQDWLRKEAAEVADKVEMLFREVFNLLHQIGQKIARSGSFYSSIKVPESRRQIAELEGMLHKETVEFEGLLQEAITSDWQVGRPVADILKLNSIRRLLLYEAYEWDRRLCRLDSSLRVKNSLAKLESSPLEDFKTPYKEYDSSINEKVGESQGTVKDSNDASNFGIPMTEEMGSTVDGNCLDRANFSGNLQFKDIEAFDKHVLSNGSVQPSMTNNVDNSYLCDHLVGTGTLNGKLDEVMETIKLAEGKTTQNLDGMEGGPDIRDSSDITKGTMFHTFDIENGECNTSINISETIPLETVDSRKNSNGLDGDLGTCHKLSEQDFPILADLSDTLDAAWTGEGQSVKAQAVPVTSQGQEVGSATSATVASGSEPADRKDFYPVKQISIGDRMMSDATLNMQDKGVIEPSEKSIPPSPVKSFHLSEEFGSLTGAPMSNLPKSYSKSFQENLSGSIRVDSLRGYSPMFVSSVSHLGGNGVGRLLLPTGVNDTVIAVYDDEPTSIIAYALSSQEYQARLSDKAPDNEKQKEKEKDKEKECADLSGMGGVVSNPLWPSDGSLDLSKVLSKERSSGSEDLYTYGFKGSRGSDLSLYTKDMHAKVSFRDEGPPGKVKYSVTCYYAKQFDALRKKCCPSEMDFRLSLSRCKKWGAQGGKSNVFFAKSLDERFIIKQVTRTELESFNKFASEYFKYLSESLSSGSPTCLAKILGIYQVTVKNAKGGKEIRMELMVMENLLFGRNVTRVYDLKGSGRSRYNADSSGNNKVLLDQNLLEIIPTSPIFLGNKAKRLLERAVWNDTSFLASIDVMDYSLLVGVDEERCELVLGIIDFMRQYTWDKHLETWVKASGILGGPKNISPTVISPKQYKKRFRKAMSTYFLMLPDQWSPSAIIPCPLQIEKNKDGSSILTEDDSGDQVA